MFQLEQLELPSVPNASAKPPSAAPSQAVAPVLSDAQPPRAASPTDETHLYLPTSRTALMRQSQVQMKYWRRYKISLSSALQFVIYPSNRT